MKKSKLPKAPEEDPSVKALRARQIEDLAEIDEEENRRLKAATRNQRGVRAFRKPSKAEAGSQVNGRTGRNLAAGGPSGGSAGGRAAVRIR